MFGAGRNDIHVHTVFSYRAYTEFLSLSQAWKMKSIQKITILDKKVSFLRRFLLVVLSITDIFLLFCSHTQLAL
jgi:hypothetical protein